ncbi:MAG: electron transfer flavoprotein subunit beta/FixA family protein [Chloroflexota bacterium]|nr:electron transfer flavoprotein subunit beta/FixA family protein [Chloroflexota bacterium]
MKIVVCVKQVPDTAATMTVEDGKISWGDAQLIINPWDEYAVEAALNIAADHGAEVIILSMGKEDETEAIKHALAMGANDAVLVTDSAMDGADNVAIAKVLAKAIQKIGDVDLALFGQQSVDTVTGLLPLQVARVLGWPALPLVSHFDAISPDEGTLRVKRALEEGKQIVDGKFPAVVSLTKDYGEPRYPSFMGIRKASRAKYPIWGLEDLEMEAPKSAVSWSDVSEPPKREIVSEIITGETPAEKAQNLVKKIMEEKVL